RPLQRVSSWWSHRAWSRRTDVEPRQAGIICSLRSARIASADASPRARSAAGLLRLLAKSPARRPSIPTWQTAQRQRSLNSSTSFDGFSPRPAKPVIIGAGVSEALDEAVFDRGSDVQHDDRDYRGGGFHNSHRLILKRDDEIDSVTHKRLR